MTFIPFPVVVNVGDWGPMHPIIGTAAGIVLLLAIICICAGIMAAPATYEGRITLWERRFMWAGIALSLTSFALVVIATVVGPPG